MFDSISLQFVKMYSLSNKITIKGFKCIQYIVRSSIKLNGSKSSIMIFTIGMQLKSLTGLNGYYTKIKVVFNFLIEVVQNKNTTV